MPELNDDELVHAPWRYVLMIAQEIGLRAILAFLGSASHSRESLLRNVSHF